MCCKFVSPVIGRKDWRHLFENIIFFNYSKLMFKKLMKQEFEI